MFMEGLILSIAGMGTVFLFLMLLVFIMRCTAQGVRMLEAKGLVAPAGAQSSTVPAKTDDMARIAAAIAIANRCLRGASK